MGEARLQLLRNALTENDQYYTPRIEKTAQFGFEYGITIIKYLFIIYGGAIIVITPIISTIGKGIMLAAFVAAGFFSFALILNALAAFIIHLNWMKLSEMYDYDRAIRANKIYQAYVNHQVYSPEEVAELESMEKTAKKTAGRYNIFGKLLGISGLALFFLGAAALIGCSVALLPDSPIAQVDGASP